MSYVKKSNSLFNPFLAWSDLAVKTSEMMMASAQVIHHRAGRMATAGPNPSMRDQREFALMGQEKMEVLAESTQAMAMQMLAINPSFGLQAFDLMMKSSNAMFSLATSTNIGQSLTRQAKLARVISESAEATSQLSDSAAKVVHRGLKPIHARATANAKRLTKT